MSGLITPRMRPLSPRRSAIYSILDIGTTKTICLMARLTPVAKAGMLYGRTHRCTILGIGHQRSRGIKGGVIVDMEQAEQSIRLAVDAAERMAGVPAENVIINMTAGRLHSHHYEAHLSLDWQAVDPQAVHAVLEAAVGQTDRKGQTVLHALPTQFSLDETQGILDPCGMMGNVLGADLHVVACDSSRVRNLMLTVERCRLSVQAIVATPYAAGLASLVEDEAEMGVALVDIGGGTTSIGVFSGGRLIHVDALAIGGHHITMDVSRAFTVRLQDSERLKALQGACFASPSDDREMIDISSGGRNQPISHVPRSHLVRVIRPRVEEILELVRDRLKRAGFEAQAGRQLVLTGGGCQLTGLPELARHIISPKVRIGRPLGIQGLPDSAKTPAFCAAVGLLLYPQMAGIEHFKTNQKSFLAATGTGGYVSRLSRWLRNSF